jgi:NADH:ubiquinone oxidoreductase subunit 3 (subunit A)
MPRAAAAATASTERLLFVVMLASALIYAWARVWGHGAS